MCRYGFRGTFYLNDLELIPPEGIAPEVFLGELLSGGCAAGAHGVRHASLAELTDSDEIFRELGVCRAMLEAAIPMLEALPSWNTDAIHDGLIALAERLEVKNATLMWPVRIAAAGKAVTPGGAVEICAILGREECLRRLNLGLEKLKA